jgi:hypothetical protein
VAHTSIEERRDGYRVLIGKHEGKTQLGRPRPRWDDYIEMDLQEAGWGHELDCFGSG